MGRRSGDADAEPELREHLIAVRSEICTLYTDVALDGGADFGEYTNRELRKGIDPLVAGGAVRLHRFELPDGHPWAAPRGGHPSDSLMLGADDVLRDDQP